MFFYKLWKKIDTSANKFHHTCPDLEVELVTNERETFLLKVYKPKKQIFPELVLEAVTQ